MEKPAAGRRALVKAALVARNLERFAAATVPGEGSGSSSSFFLGDSFEDM